MNLILDHIFQKVKSDFCSLVDAKMRGDTLEIITSIPTLTSSYVSVFISQQGKRFIVSDGGWIYNNYYENYLSEETDSLKRIYSQYQKYFKVKETPLSINQGIYYYKTTENIELISALVFDVGHFVSSIVNTQNVIFKELEDDDRKLFHNRMNGYIRERFGQEKVELNQTVQITEKQRIRFNAIVHANARDHYYVMYVSGSRASYFIKDLAEATVNFEIINDFSVKKEYFKKLAIINTSAPGFDKERSEVYLERLAKAIDRNPVLIRNKNDDFKIAEALPVG